MTTSLAGQHNANSEPQNAAPSFIGLGVQKGGTSWLYRQLQKHPEIYVPTDRKEIHFFDTYFEKGQEWYLDWFKSKDSAKAWGEITPEYIYFENVPQRIQETLKACAIDQTTKFLVMLRHPVLRAYSHYQMIFQSGQGQKYRDFRDFMETHPHGFKRGLYSVQLSRYFELFPKENFLILVSEDIFLQAEGKEDDSYNEGYIKAFKDIGRFLEIDPALFDLESARSVVGGARNMPRSALLASWSQKIRERLRDFDMDWVATALKKRGITRRIFETKTPIPPLSAEDRSYWLSRYQEDITKLKDLLNRGFPDWT